MNATAMEPIVAVSPRVKARTAGALYLLIFVTASFAEIFVRTRFVVSGDAVATAANILAHEQLFRWGFAAALLTLTFDAAIALLLHELLKPVSRSLSLQAASFRLAFVAIMAVNSMNYFAPLVLLNRSPTLTAFTTAQLQELALASQSLYSAGYCISLVFFGIHIVLIGWLIFRSAFLPGTLGVLLAIAGLCYIFNSFLTFLAPARSAAFGLYLLIPGGLAELLLTLWLLVVGVNVQRWMEQAGTAAQ